MVYLSYLNGTEVTVKHLILDKRADGDHMDEINKSIKVIIKFIQY